MGVSPPSAADDSQRPLEFKKPHGLPEERGSRIHDEKKDRIIKEEGRIRM